jgi:hypothetical protein
MVNRVDIVVFVHLGMGRLLYTSAYIFSQFYPRFTVSIILFQWWRGAIDSGQST